MRYLTLTGLTFFMALMVSSGHQVKLSVLIFGATVYLVTGMTSVMLPTTQEEMDHARTLGMRGMSKWRSFYEVVVLGKLDEMLEVKRIIVEVTTLDELNTVIIVSHDIVTTTALADRLWLLGYEHDAAGAFVPGATINPQHQYNLAEMGLAWHENVEPEPEFA